MATTPSTLGKRGRISARMRCAANSTAGATHCTVMRDTGFMGLRLTQFPRILETYSITTAQMEAEVSKRGLHVVTISFNGQAQDASKRKDVLDSAKVAMTFLKNFGAERLVVF